MTEENFSLHPQLAADTVILAEWTLCCVTLRNDARFPWLILVPSHGNASEITDLPQPEQMQLMREINRASLALKQVCSPDRINVASLGNIVPQLHVHIIARFKEDAAWPGPVWGHGEPEAYGERMNAVAAAFKKALAVGEKQRMTP